MDKKINRHFCVQPFVNVTTRVTGDNNVCCNTITSPSNIAQETPNAFFNSNYTKDFRSKLLNGEKLEACRLCQYLEENSKHSHRLEYNKYYNIKNNQPFEYYEKIIKKLRLENLSNPAYADIHVNNLCNLKCLTCNDKDSSRFHAESKALGISKYPTDDFSKSKANIEETINSVITKDLLFLDLRGGETLMVPEVKSILEKIDERKAKKITLKIQTNGTIVPDAEWCSIFKKFKRTKVNVSVDAYGEDINYIRYPADWSKILETLDVLKREDILFIINTVVSNLNIMILDKLFKWIQDNKYLNYFYILDWPKHYRPNNLPKSFLDTAKKRLQNVEDNFVNKNCYKKVKDLLGVLDKQEHESNWQRFCREIEMKDKYRKNSITKIIPQIKEHMNAKIRRDQ